MIYLQISDMIQKEKGKENDPINNFQLKFSFTNRGNQIGNTQNHGFGECKTWRAFENIGHPKLSWSIWINNGEMEEDIHSSDGYYMYPSLQRQSCF